LEARCERGHAANLRSPSQSVRDPTTWFQLGLIGDAGPEITDGLGIFLCATRPEAQPTRIAQRSFERGREEQGGEQH